MKASTLKEVFPISSLGEREKNIIEDSSATVYPSTFTKGVYVVESASDCFLFSYNKPGFKNYSILK